MTKPYTHNQQCTKCGIWKNKKNHFYKNTNGRYRPKCKACEGHMNKKIKHREDPFYDCTLIELSKLHRSVRYNPFGCFIGVLIIFRKKSTMTCSQIMACSQITDRKKLCETQAKAKEFLVMELSRASDRVRVGLTKPRKRG